MDADRRAEADRFLSLLGDRHTFLTFGEGSAKGRKGLTRELHGTLAEHADTLARLNAQGAGVFVMVNAGDGKGRAAGNVRRVRAFFVDLDGAPLAPVQAAPLSPHCIVASSPGKWHAYWIVADCPPGDFWTLQKALAARFHGDAKVCDLPRVMRLPGFLHRKGEPFLSRITTVRNGPPFTFAEVREAFGIGEPARTAPAAKPAASMRRVLPATIPEGERNATLFNLACGLAKNRLNQAAIAKRLRRINAERCTTPLPASEVEEIAKQATMYGSAGFTLLPDTLDDAPEWKSLKSESHDIMRLAYRRAFHGDPQGIVLLPEDFDGYASFRQRGTFYRHLRALVNAGLLVQTRPPRNTQRGREPAHYAIPDRWRRSASVEIRHRRQCRNSTSYIEIQEEGIEGLEEASGANETERAA